MYIYLAHNAESFRKKNYKKYTKKEFIDLVRKIAKENRIDEDLLVINFKKMDEPGKCQLFLNKGYLFFSEDILKGKIFTVFDVEEIIKHELAHYIANTRYNTSCGHDKLWQKVAKEIGCHSTNTVLEPQAETRLIMGTFKPKSTKFYYYLRCNKCDKLYYKANDIDGVFQFFLVSGTDIPLPLVFNDLPMKTKCCKVSYKFEANAEMFLKEIEKENNECFDELKKNLKKLIAENKD